MSRVFLLVAALSLMTGHVGPGAEALASLRSLAGEWEGPLEWSGARTGTGTMSVSYSLTGNGSAVVENISDVGGATPAMTSVYHLDGADLRMTHYCGAENQPRLRAQHIDIAHGAIDFAFVDVTNLRSPGAPHVHGVEMRLMDPDHITLTFLFRSGGQESRERITLTRRSQKSR
jgi:hypothetical protein